MPRLRCHDCDQEFSVPRGPLGTHGIIAVRSALYFVCQQCAQDIPLDQEDDYGEAVSVRGDIHLSRFLGGALIALHRVPLPRGVGGGGSGPAELA